MNSTKDLSQQNNINKKKLNNENDCKIKMISNKALNSINNTFNDIKKMISGKKLQKAKFSEKNKKSSPINKICNKTLKEFNFDNEKYEKVTSEKVMETFQSFPQPFHHERLFNSKLSTDQEVSISNEMNQKILQKSRILEINVGKQGLKTLVFKITDNPKEISQEFCKQNNLPEIKQIKLEKYLSEIMRNNFLIKQE